MKQLSRSKNFKLRAKGSRACFTRPLARGERLTYDVPTPSAGVGLFETVLWHPGLKWRVTLIEVLNQIRYFNMRTNEVKEKGGARPINAAKERTQRNTVGLYDVDYVFTGYFVLDGTAQHNVPAFEEMFERYRKHGQIYHTPFFGMQPFFCDVMEAPESYTPIESGIDRPLGPMFYGWDYDKTPPQPLTFDARLTNGVVHVPSYEDVVADNTI